MVLELGSMDDQEKQDELKLALLEGGASGDSSAEQHAEAEIAALVRVVNAPKMRQAEQKRLEKATEAESVCLNR